MIVFVAFNVAASVIAPPTTDPHGARSSEILSQDALKNALFGGSFLEKIRERLLSYRELELSGDATHPPLAFKNLDRQVIQSRIVLNHGACLRTSARPDNLSVHRNGDLFSLADALGRAGGPVPALIRTGLSTIAPGRSCRVHSRRAPATCRRRASGNWTMPTTWKDVPVVATDFM